MKLNCGELASCCLKDKCVSGLLTQMARKKEICDPFLDHIPVATIPAY